MIWPPGVSIALFVLAAFVIGIAGVRLAALADTLADQTGLGEAVFGALFLGATTSLSGSVTSVVSAMQGHPQLAISNALGGIAAQTAFLAIADVAYLRANLEHAAASAANIIQASFLTVLLATVLLAITGPDVTLWGIHPASIAMILTYVFSMRVLSRTNRWPMWKPLSTSDTVVDKPLVDAQAGPIKGSLIHFLLLVVLVGGAGWVLAHSAISIATQTGLSETLIGTVFTAVSTSLPELVTAVAAVRMGALTLAVSDIVGGNVFDTLMFPMTDIAYRKGSVYHALSTDQIYWIGLNILLTSILLIGLVYRERHGIANIGLESFLILTLYVGGITVLLLTS